MIYGRTTREELITVAPSDQVAAVVVDLATGLRAQLAVLPEDTAEAEVAVAMAHLRLQMVAMAHRASLSSVTLRAMLYPVRKQHIL